MSGSYGFTDGNDRIRLPVIIHTPSGPTIVDAMAGDDEVTLSGEAANQVSLLDAETVFGAEQDDTVIVLAPVTAGGTIRLFLGGGFDEVTFEAPMTSILHSVESVTGSAGDDHFTILRDWTTTAEMGVNGAEGFDTLVLQQTASAVASPEDSGFEPLVYLMGVEAVTGSAFNDAINFYAGIPGPGATVDLGEGLDVVMLGSPSAGSRMNLLATSATEAVIGSAGRDVVRAAQGLAFADLGAGEDRVELGSLSPNKVELSNVEAVLGGSRADEVTISGDAEIISIDLGGGVDTLRLTQGSSNFTQYNISNVERITGSDADETLVIRSSQRGGEIDLGGGWDSINLSDRGNSIAVRNVEATYGGAGADGIVVRGGEAARLYGNGGNDVLSGGDGDDTIVGGLGKDVMTGGAGADSFVFASIDDSDVNTRDIITDFQVGVDKLVFLEGGRDFSLLGAGAFTASGTTEIRFLDAADQLLIDMDGDGAVDMRMTLQGVDGTQLSAGDFLFGLR